MAILEVNHIEKHFGKTQVLRDVSFSMEEGSALAIIGSSGSGKTTLLRCLNFLEKPNSGSINVNGEVLFDASLNQSERDADLRKKRLHFGMVFQSFNLFCLTVNVSIKRLDFLQPFHCSHKSVFLYGIIILSAFEQS